MNKNYATLTVSRAVDTILDKGAQRLYDRYLQQKLPNHTYERNDQQFQNNIQMMTLHPSLHQKVEVVPSKIIQNIPIDTLAAKRIPFKRSKVEGSILKQNDTTIDKSTKYQTIIHSQNTIIEANNRSKDIQESMLLEESFKRSPLLARTERPSTMQVGRATIKDDNNAFESFKIEEVEQKRAATCHVRKRKSFASVQAEKKRFVRLRQEGTPMFRQQVQSLKQAQKDKKERSEQEAQTDRFNAQEQARARMREKRTRDDFESLRKQLKGKGKSPGLTNFQSHEGEIVINGKCRVPQTHIIQLEFNPEQQQTLFTLQPRHSTVSPSKTRSFFSTKLKKKLKLSDEQFTNNGSRQISSIPFVALSYGIAITQNGLEASASRRRPSNQITRDKFTEEQQTKFKSHIPIVNSARFNIFSTVDAQLTVRSSLVDNNHLPDKNLETTLESKPEMQRSLLWKPRSRSENKAIRVSNKEIVQRQMLSSKLALQE